MSKTGKNPVALPEGVKVSLADGSLSVEGPKGKVAMRVHPLVSVVVDEKARQIRVAPREFEGRDPKKVSLQRAMWGTTRSLIANMVEGVTRGFTIQLQVVGVGYAARIDGKNLMLRCGFSNEIAVPIPEGVTVEPPKVDSLMITGVGQVPCTMLTMHSADKELIGQFAASVRAKRPPEPYKGKGIRYFGEEVKRKAGKALAAGAT